MKNITKYLAHYAEPEARELNNFPENHSFDFGLVIPAYKESGDFYQYLKKQNLLNNNLLVVVINQPDSDKNQQPQRLLVERLTANSTLVWQHQHLELHRETLDNNENTWLLIIKRFENQLSIPDKQGVGLARKIGADCLVAIYSRKQLKSPWIFSSDADARLPHNYFSAAKNTVDSSAMVFSFKHQYQDLSASQLSKITQLYELAMRYYVAGLSWAGSPYAYHSLGSALAIDIESYCQVRGFPKRSAGEDFYLLNKLAKLRGIQQTEQIVIELEPRQSDRVPFGTGPKVEALLNLANPETDYLYYSPVVFKHLKSVIALLNNATLVNVSDINNSLTDECKSALLQLGLFDDIEKIIANSKSDIQLRKQLHEWFDAFRTLKFIHHLRDKFYPNMPLLDAVEQAPFDSK